jgi:hypothetical protein
MAQKVAFVSGKATLARDFLKSIHQARLWLRMLENREDFNSQQRAGAHQNAPALCCDWAFSTFFAFPFTLLLIGRRNSFT